MTFSTDIAVRAADAARGAAAQNPAPYWVVAAVPTDGQPWIDVVNAFSREGDARARLAQLSIAPRVLAALYASDGSGRLTLRDLWGPGYQRMRVDDTRGRYGNEVIGASVPGEQRGWGTWAAIGALTIGGIFLLRTAAKTKKLEDSFWNDDDATSRARWDQERKASRKRAMKALGDSGKRSIAADGGNAFWDVYGAPARFHK